MPTLKTGAFVQQCFSVHPLSLSVKILRPPDRVVLLCGNCDMRHRLTWRGVTTGAAEGLSQDGVVAFESCATAHPAELRISGVDVMTDAVKLRCGECRRGYTLDIAAFETYRKD